MRVSTMVGCDRLGRGCPGALTDGHLVPDVDIEPHSVTTVLISEAPPADPADGYYAAGDPLFARTTVDAFNAAGVPVSSIRDIVDLGVYLTTAIKCRKVGYTVGASTIDACSLLLERELALFDRARAYLLMGDVAIAAINKIARRAGTGRAVPAGSTYRIRGGEYHLGPVRVFPSYLQAGPSYYIEKGKRTVIAEDIAAALRCAREAPDAG